HREDQGREDERRRRCVEIRQTVGMIYVVTYIDVQPSSTSDAVKLMKRYQAGSSGDDALWIGGLQEISRANRFALVEAWPNDASLVAHESAPHTSRFRTALQAIHNSPYD